MINTALLPADKDPMGAAIADYFKRHKADRLRVFSSQFDEDEIPVEELFRTEKQMPLLERTALQMATGKFWNTVPVRDIAVTARSWWVTMQSTISI